jgi:hypothetical protein
MLLPIGLTAPKPAFLICEDVTYPQPNAGMAEITIRARGLLARSKLASIGFRIEGKLFDAYRSRQG